jgi:hypothetical protein
MGIALLTLSGLFQGFSVMGRKPLAVTPADHPRVLRMVRPATDRAPIQARPVSSICKPRPAALRVVRVCDAAQDPREMGRLVISGRMADVCAELDRLVAKEAAQQAQATRH